MLVRVLVDRRELDAAEKVLIEGLQLQDRAEIRRAISELYLLRLSLLQPSEEPGGDLRERIRLISEASRFDASNPAVYIQLAALHEGISDPEYRQSIQAELERLIATGSAAAFAHFTLGSILWPYGEPQKALFHVERSLELDPQFTDAANNLAWILASQETPDLERAEGLIRQAIAKKASDIRYQDTLALILAGKGQWKETLAILEKILPYVPGSALRDTHLRLAEAYDEIGDKNLASLHRELADGPKR